MKQTVLSLILFLCIGAGLVFLGCVSQSTIDPGAPDVYILEPHPDGARGLLYTIGISESRDLSMARSMAIQRARTAMAQKARLHVIALSEDFQQQLGTDAKAKINTVFRQVSRSLTGATLNGTTVITTKATEKEGVYSVQLMLGMPIKSNIETPIVAAIDQDETLYQEFQAWKGSNELAEKIKYLHEREGQQ